MIGLFSNTLSLIFLEPDFGISVRLPRLNRTRSEVFKRKSLNGASAAATVLGKDHAIRNECVFTHMRIGRCALMNRCGNSAQVFQAHFSIGNSGRVTLH